MIRTVPGSWRRTGAGYPTGFLLILFCLTFTLAASAGSPGTEKRPAMISVTLGGLMFLDDDIDETYGTMPIVGLRIARQLDKYAEAYFDVQHGSDSGNPFYDTPDFRSGKETSLRVIPIGFGLRINASTHKNFKFYFGIGLRYVWAGEKVPWNPYASGSGDREYSGWGWGSRMLIGPEWRDSAGKMAYGVELAFGPLDVETERGGWNRVIDLSGPDTRAYVSFLF